MCPQLVLVEQDPAAVEREWEGVLQRVEDRASRSTPRSRGRVDLLEDRGASSGLHQARRRRRAGARLRRSCLGIHARARRSAGSLPLRRGERRASRAGTRRVGGKEEGSSGTAAALVLPLPADRYAELEGLGVRRGGAGRPARGSCRRAARPGKAGRRGARARRRQRSCARTAAGGGARRGAGVPGAGRERVDAPPWLGRRSTGCRPGGVGGLPVPQGRALGEGRSAAGPGADGDICASRRPTGPLRAALGPKPSDIPARRRARLEAVELSESVGADRAVKPVGDEMQARLSDGWRQVRASTVGLRRRRRGGGAVVVDSRTRSLFVPRDE